jgi:hypothetical protein
VSVRGGVFHPAPPLDAAKPQSPPGVRRRRLRSGHAAIDWKIHSGDEARFVRGQEQGGCGDFLRTTEPPERNGCRESGARLIGPFLGRRLLLEDRRVDWAGADCVDPDPTILQLGRPSTDERTDGSLGRTVGRESRNALSLSDRGDHDDGPAIVQKRECLLYREGEAPRVDRKDLVEALFRGLGERLGVDDTSASEEDVELVFFLADPRVESRSRSARFETSAWMAVTLRPISETALSSSVRRRPVM